MVVEIKEDKELDRICELYDYSSSIYREALRQLGNPDRRTDLEGYIMHLFLLRFSYNFKAVSSLLKLYIQDRLFKIPIYLILRACSSDILTLYYFLSIIKKNGTNTDVTQKEIYSFLVDHLHRVLKENIGRDNNRNRKFDDEELGNLFQVVFPDFYNSEKKLIENNVVSIKKMYEYLNKSKEFAWITDAYAHYLYMSKFEHVGVLTDEIQEFHREVSWFDSNGILLEFSLLYDALNPVIHSIDSSELKIMQEKLATKLNEFIHHG